jgi:PAS domain S-box-containing protein
LDVDNNRWMSGSSEKPGKRGRSAGRLDLLVVVLVTVAVFSFGALAGTFSIWERWLEERAPSSAPNLLGLSLLILGALASYGVLRARISRRESAFRKETELRFQALVEQVPAVTYTWDPTVPTGQAAPIYVSPQLKTLLGYDPSEWADNPRFWIERLHSDDRERVLAASDESDKTGAPFDEEYRIYAKDGRIVWLRDEALVVARDDDGRPMRVQGVMYDITSRKQAELQLQEAENRYRKLVENLPVVTYLSDTSDADGMDVLRYVSPGLEQLTGYSADECVGQRQFWESIIHPDDRERFTEISMRVDQTGEPFDAEYRVVRKDGSVIWLHEVGVVVKRETDRTTWQGVFEDVTRRRQTEQLLRQADERFRTLVEQLPAITYIEDALSKRITYISPQIEAIFGFTAGEWLADPDAWVKSLHPDDRERVVEANDDDSSDTWSVDYRTITRTGHELWVHNEAVLVRNEDGSPAYWQGVVFDISDRKAAEGRLRAAEERYRTLVEQLPVAVYMDAVDELSTALYISPQYERITGYSAQERMEDPGLWVHMLHPEDRDRVLIESSRTNTTGDPFDIEYRIVAKDGRTVWMHDHAFLATGPDGRGAWQGVLTDITEHKEAEHQLRSAEERFRAIVEHIPSAIYLDVPDASLRTLYVSPQIEEITGISPEDWTARPEAWVESIHPADREAVLSGYNEAIAHRSPWRNEYRIRRRDGRTIWVNDETTFLSSDADGEVVMLGVISDITERKLAEQALRESEQKERDAAERLRALDEMKNTFLAAVSHELRSPLTSILGLSLTLERGMELADADRADLLERLAANARKLDRLLKDLLDIDRLNRGIVEPQYRVSDVGTLARRTVETLDALKDRTVVMHVEPVVISADPAKVERIVENLLMNAARHTAPDRTIWLRVESCKGGVLVAVEDDGVGVPEELRDAIFEPFRQGPTASPHAPGTGIGLSLVIRFSELHGGRAWVEDRQGGGASFRVFLPGGPDAEPMGPELPRFAHEVQAQPNGNGRGNGKARRNGRKRAAGPAAEHTPVDAVEPA